MGIVTTIGTSLPAGEVHSPPVFFASNDCSGTPYVMMDAMHAIAKLAGKYYTGKLMSMIELQSNSLRDSYSGSCFEVTWNPGGLIELTEEISLPFNTPVALPLRIE